MKSILNLAINAVFAYLLMPIFGFLASGFLVEFWVKNIFSFSMIDNAVSGNKLSVLFWFVFIVFNLKKGIEWYLFSDLDD